ncbi:MAG: hypoxanthine phosphoribosyltransferase [Bacteroidaceae bacterium]|nr:hypoxanthine phosphoribosyltransferase [Bacteroidaceae bacterium]MBR5962960.1 hypoxanthine phosphoribosyltransferase [Bacteroidaceae bacterium]
MNSIQIKDKKFEISIPESYIQKKVEELAERISADLEGKDPLFLGVLNGSFIFAADLFRNITIPAQISFVKLASYEGTASTGVIKEVIGLSENISGRCIVIVEDIIDSGLTMQKLVENLGTRQPAEIHICTLLSKPDNIKVPLDIEYVALEIPNDFIVGYGLDYDGWGRNTRDIYSVVNE